MFIFFGQSTESGSFFNYSESVQHFLACHIVNNLPFGAEGQTQSLDSYFVTGDLRLVLQSFDLLPVQDDLGVGRVPHHFNGRLTWCCKNKHVFHHSPHTEAD